MGREQKSRRRVPSGTLCYLCGKPIRQHDSWNRDHLPPAAFFGSALKRVFAFNLPWLYTHQSCNSAYRGDEEYTIAALAGHAQSATGNAVMDDLRSAFRQGHKHGLLRMIVSAFGKLTGPRGEATFALNRTRVERIAWKLARGIYYRELGLVLPESRPGHPPCQDS